MSQSGAQFLPGDVAYTVDCCTNKRYFPHCWDQLNFFLNSDSSLIPGERLISLLVWTFVNGILIYVHGWLNILCSVQLLFFVFQTSVLIKTWMKSINKYLNITKDTDRKVIQVFILSFSLSLPPCLTYNIFRLPPVLTFTPNFPLSAEGEWKLPSECSTCWPARLSWWYCLNWQQCYIFLSIYPKRQHWSREIGHEGDK